ncbi:MAG: flagellar basal body P-ring formation protein FlgA [Fuerstiella sp.]|nr:flagellar basal body P-ring formation protein FlgA [Fuerstiella sp.]
MSQRLRWDGPTSVRVRGGGVAADVDALRRAAQATLSNWLDERFEQTTLKGVGTLKKMTVPVGEIVFRPRVRLGQRLRKRIPVWVDVLVDKQHFQTVPVWFAVSVQAPVLMLKQAFDKHHQLQIEDVTEAVLDITTLKAVPVVKGSLLTKRLSRAMDDGSVLTEDDVELTPAVSQGQLITVFAQHGGVSLISKGIALADGAVQQTIAVRNPDSGESYRAMVIGNEQARVN